MTLTMIAVNRTRSYPPRVTKFTQRFWSSLADGQLTTTRCEACTKLTFPPKPFCPHCWSKSVVWTALSGKGSLYSQTVIHAAPRVFMQEIPYRVGIVDLDEKLRIATRIIADAEPRLGAPVEIVTLNYQDGPLFAARPLAS